MKTWTAAFIILLLGSNGLSSTLKLKRIETPLKGLGQMSLNGREIPAEKHWIFQFQKTVNSHHVQAVERHGFKVINYLPDNALLVRALKPFSVQNIEGLTDFQGLVPYQPAWKISENLENGDLNATLTITIKGFEMGATDGLQLRNDLSTISNLTVLGQVGSLMIVQMPRYLLNKVAELESVEWIDIYRNFKTLDFEVPLDALELGRSRHILSDEGYESGTKLMNFDSAWERGFNGEGQTVAMVDTGLDRGSLTDLHTDLVGAILKGFILTPQSKSWGDPHGHGTHVAGSILGRGSLDGRLKGGAFKAQLLVGSVMTSTGDFNIPSDPKKLFGTFKSEGARIHSDSWGGDAEGEYDAFAAMVDGWVWNNPDVLLVFSAGNAGVDSDRNGVIDPGSMGTPATSKNVLTVGASENFVSKGGYQRPLGQVWPKDYSVEPYKSDLISNNPQGLAAFSSRGPTKDGRIKPDVVAPGTNIVSLRSRMSTKTLWGVFDQNYVYCGGTSMSAPLTSGAAAVVRQYLIKNRSIPNPSAALLKGVLMASAVDLYPGQFGLGEQQEIRETRPNASEGFGRVDVAQSTRLDDALLVDDTNGVAANQEKTFEFQVVEGKKHLRILLVYTDAPGSVSGQKALVNDLDMNIQRPGGSQRTLNDRLNNSEFFEVKSAMAGTYKISVKGFRVVKGNPDRVPFALIAFAE